MMANFALHHSNQHSAYKLDTHKESLIIIADSNIAGLDDFFNPDALSLEPQQTLKLTRVAGRDIDAQLLSELQPDVLLIRSVTSVGESLLKDNRSVKFVGSATIGTDHIDQAYLSGRNVRFANAIGSSKHSVAQYVLSAILTLRADYWQRPITLGIIGLGNIGSTLAEYADSLGWQLLGYDPLLPKSKLNNASFEQVLSQSDVVSLHVPLTSDNFDTVTNNYSNYPTQHLIDAAALNMLPAHTMLINTARGPVIDASALVADIDKTGRQVVLDVFEFEPQIAESLLTKLAVATPHIAGYTLEGKLRGTQMIYEALCEQLHVIPKQSINHLLPVNMYLWSELKANPDKLIKFYDIKQDNSQLRSKSVDGRVNAPDFDQLRRDYHLRREWQL